MEYSPGGDLYSILQNIGCLEEDDARVYAVQIIAALEFLRQNNVVHRDLKPDNILVDASGRLKLTDFGLSFFGMVGRSISGNITNKMFEDVCVGTPDYMSPEIVLSQKHTFTSDYWALGCLLYEFLAGVPPFHGETPGETFQNIIRGQYCTEILGDCSAELCDFISKLLCHDPEHRLGVESIDELKNHPWFADVVWTQIGSFEPPFVPSLDDETDTSYFETRYTFEDGNENDILEDIRASERDVYGIREGRPRASLLSLLEEEEENSDDGIESFPSMAVLQLQEATQADARRKRSLSGAHEENFLSNIEDDVTPKKRVRRRLPRVSLSPKVGSPHQPTPSLLATIGSVDSDVE